jgi:hypothetical protein
MKSYQLKIGTATLAIMFAQLAAQASLTTLTPNSYGSVGTTSDSTVLGSASLTSPFSNGQEAGSLSTWVLTGDAANPYGSQDLTFVYQVNETGSDYIGALVLDGFGGSASVKVGYAGSGTAPLFASLLGSSGTLNLNFVFTGFQNSANLYVYTSATASTASIANVEGGYTASASIRSPLAVVPEPTTMVGGALMFCMGMLVILRNGKMVLAWRNNSSS